MNTTRAEYHAGRGHERSLTPNSLEKLITCPNSKRSRSKHSWPYSTPPQPPTLQEAGSSSSSSNQLIRIQNQGFRDSENNHKWQWYL